MSDQAGGVCPRCRHSWTSHGLVPHKTNWPPCCVVNVGQGDPCGCTDTSASADRQ